MAIDTKYNAGGTGDLRPFSCRASLALHISGCRWFAYYMGMDNYTHGWTTGDCDFY